MLNPVTVMPVERYTPQRQAEFLLSNAVDQHDYEEAVQIVKAMGFNPETITHCKPGSMDQR